MVFYVVGDSSSIGMKRKKERMQKGTKMEKKDECCSIGRNLKTGSSFNAAALKTKCRSIGKKGRNPEIGRIANAAALRSECRGIEE